MKFMQFMKDLFVCLNNASMKLISPALVVESAVLSSHSATLEHWVITSDAGEAFTCVPPTMIVEVELSTWINGFIYFFFIATKQILMALIELFSSTKETLGQIFVS